jgi:hypothetical protein
MTFIIKRSVIMGFMPCRDGIDAPGAWQNDLDTIASFGLGRMDQSALKLGRGTPEYPTG